MDNPQTQHKSPLAYYQASNLMAGAVHRPSLAISPGRTTSHESTRNLFPGDGNEDLSKVLVEGPVGVVGQVRKNIVLCFDGTGNQFRGDSSDSNILKIFRMLDRSSGKGFHYYQPGIGTYVAAASLSNTGSIQKLKHWYEKAKDSAVGSSFDQHVVGGYKFLMQFYSPGDNVYMFGFSRGSYTARFLAEMLDWVGLITHGNEEMIQFAWRTFSKWKSLAGTDKETRAKQSKAYDFMVSFRETFSRPVRRIRFLGLFDTVNSVPRFENAILSHKRVPFSAISSAKVIRHAVAIDERRAKFRCDIVPTHTHSRKEREEEASREGDDRHNHSRYKPSGKPSSRLGVDQSKLDVPRGSHDGVEKPTSRYRGRSRPPQDFIHSSNASVIHSDVVSFIAPAELVGDDDSSDDESDQDIEEMWFPGGHADIGGGWDVSEGETPLSHVPLVWIVREAKRRGLGFDECKMRALGCWEEANSQRIEVPIINLPVSIGEEQGLSNPNGVEAELEFSFKPKILDAATKGVLHDCLSYGKGAPAATVLRWRLMEYIPFRRLDLSVDGKWVPIRWPLPRGEVRDMPDNARVHHSAIKRMEYDPNYRPGNLILGGGGRGLKKAPKEAGIGEWEVVAEPGDVVGERVVRKKRDDKVQRQGMNSLANNVGGVKAHKRRTALVGL